MEEKSDKKTKLDDSGVTEGGERSKKQKLDSCEDFKTADAEQQKMNDNLVGITFEVVSNNNTDEASIRLVDLKNIFSRQLPKMPKEYIVRLVFDHRHISVAMVRHGRTIGGICYRPYPEQRFGEIAFCAISGNEQLKGYGSILMNQLKRHVQKDKIEYFLTYADNYAIGYFQRQGFSKSISMPKERWMGYIKDYDGGTLMECYVHPAMDYLSVRAVVAKQRAFILQRIKERSEAETVYDGLELFQQGRRLQNLIDVPGVQQAGWTQFHLYKGSTDRDRNLNQGKLGGVLKGLLDKVRASPHSQPFRMPISLTHSRSTNQLSTYGGTASSSGGGAGDSSSNGGGAGAGTGGGGVEDSEALDLSVVTNRLRLGDYYRHKDMMKADLIRMVNYMRSIHAEGTEQALAAEALRKVVLELFSDAAGGAGAASSAAAAAT